MPGLPIAAIPHPMAGQSPDQVAAIASQALGEIVHILTHRLNCWKVNIKTRP